jgi:hypothetical protein
MVARWPECTARLVEDKANGTAVINTLKSKIPGIVPISPTESKYSRASAVAPMIEAGNVFLPAADIAMFDVDELVEEAAAFPNGAHDDQVDATSQALARLLLDGIGASAWIEYLKRLATGAAPRDAPEAASVAPEPAHPPEPVEQPMTDAERLRAARNAMFRAQYR